MRRWLLTAALAAMTLAGCLESKQDYTLNPDGSGKVVFLALIEDMPFNLNPDEKPDPELAAKQTAKQILEKSGGVETWADVTLDRAEDGRIRFRGTAFFRDFSKLRFQTGTISGLSFAKDDQGGMVLLLGEDEAKKAAKPPVPPPAALTDEQMAQRLVAERAKYQQMRPLMEMAVAKMKMDLSFLLPGTVAETNNFQKEPSGALRVVVDGAKVLLVLDQMVADDATMREMIRSGGDLQQGGPKMDDAVSEKLFGSKGPVRARVAGDLKPLFAYEAEAAAAKANYPKMIERLGLDKLPVPAPSPTPPGGRDFGGEGKATERK